MKGTVEAMDKTVAIAAALLHQDRHAAALALEMGFRWSLEGAPGRVGGALYWLWHDMHDAVHCGEAAVEDLHAARQRAVELLWEGEEGVGPTWEG